MSRGQTDGKVSSRRAFIGGGLAASLAGAAEAGDWLDIGIAARRLRRRELSAVELTRACLDRIAALNKKLNAFITVTAETALEQARAADAELRAGRSRGPLHGIPVALKDVIDTAGVRTTAGSAQYAERIPAEDAEVVRRLKEAGAVLLGKLNMDEFAYSFTSETSHFGPARNPWDTARSPGGSSGGAAIAVATGMCLAALGSDTGGSVRLPAALCGVTGLKPTYGRVDARGVVPLAWTLDHVGPLCRSAQDTAAVLSAIGDPARPAGPVRQLRLAAARGMYFEKLAGEVARLVETAIAEMGRIAAGVRDIRFPALPPSPRWPDLPQVYSTVIGAESYTYHQAMLEKTPERYHPATRATLEGGAAIRTPEYILARREVERLRAESNSIFAGADVLLTPTAPAPAFRLGEPAGLIYLRNCAAWNVYGLPSLSVPCGFTSAGLPAAVQLTGRHGMDETLLALAAAYQGATAWHARRVSI